MNPIRTGDLRARPTLAVRKGHHKDHFVELQVVTEYLNQLGIPTYSLEDLRQYFNASRFIFSSTPNQNQRKKALTKYYLTMISENPGISQDELIRGALTDHNNHYLKTYLEKHVDLVRRQLVKDYSNDDFPGNKMFYRYLLYCLEFLRIFSDQPNKTSTQTLYSKWS